MGKYDELFVRIKEKVKDVDRVIFEFVFEKEFFEFYKVVRYYFFVGGKCVRFFVVFCVVEVVGGDLEKVFYLVVFVEFIYNYFFVYDDIMDMDEFRCGRLIVYKFWGVNMVIFVGDLFFSKVFEVIVKVEVLVEKKVRILDVFVRIFNFFCEGQVFDIEFEMKEEVIVEEYFKMISGKIGVFFQGLVEIGVIVGMEDEEYIGVFLKWGMNVGIVFQIWDDVFDLIVDEEKFGKFVGSDIRKGKKMFIVSYFFEYVSEEDKVEFLKVFGKYVGDVKGDVLIYDENVKEEVVKVIEFFKKYGSIDYVVNYVKNFIREVNEVFKVFFESEVRRDFEFFVEFFVEREF